MRYNCLYLIFKESRFVKIAIVANTSWNIYNFRLNLIHFFLAHKYEVVCIAPVDRHTEALTTLPVTFVPVEIDSKGNNPIKDARLVGKFLSIYKKHKPDVILQYTIKPNIYGTLAAKLCGIPTINTVTGLGTVFLHDTCITRLAQQLYAFSFKFATVAVFQNEDDRDIFVQKRIITHAKTQIIKGSGVNTTHFIPAKTYSKAFAFLMVARLLYDKGIREYAQAAKCLHEQHGNNVQCLLIGAIDSDKQLGINKEDVHAWANRHHLIYKPFDTAILKEYQQANVVVLPSYREGLSKSLLEAGACGKPLIASNVSGCKEIVIDNWNGYLCEAKDAGNLFDKMNLMLETSPEQLAEMGKNSRDFIEQNFSDKIISNDYFYLIKRVTESKKTNTNDIH